MKLKSFILILALFAVCYTPGVVPLSQAAPRESSVDVIDSSIINGEQSLLPFEVLFIRLHNWLIKERIYQGTLLRSSHELWHNFPAEMLLAVLSTDFLNSDVLITSTELLALDSQSGREALFDDSLVVEWFERQDRISSGKIGLDEEELIKVDAVPFLQAYYDTNLLTRSQLFLHQNNVSIFLLQKNDFREFSRDALRELVNTLSILGESGDSLRTAALQLAGASRNGSLPKYQTMAGSALGGVITPSNKDLVVFTGNNSSPAHSQSVRSFLVGDLGYTLHPINASGNFQAGDEGVLTSLLSAQSLILNVLSGGFSPTKLQCYRDIQGFETLLLPDGMNHGITTQCCERLRATAEALNIPGSASLDCDNSHPSNRSVSIAGALHVQDVTVSPCGPHNCPCGGTAPNPCSIAAGINFLDFLGPKAALITAQCFGGKCTHNLDIADYLGRSVAGNYSGADGCDDLQLAEDLKGDSAFCKKTTPPAGQHEPWDGLASAHCGFPDTEIYPSSPSTLRTIQESVKSRRAWSSAWINGCEDSFNPAGLKQYQIAKINGNQSVAVEFAPTVSQAVLAGSSMLTIDFTSALSSCEVELELVGGFAKDSSNDLYYNKGCGNSNATVSFSTGADANFKFLPQSEWLNTSASDMRDKYGHDQNDWPWYLKVTVEGQAANGVKLIGNSGATNHWLWASNEFDNLILPYTYQLGLYASGDNPFELHIPIEPPLSCCMPKVELKDSDGCGDMVPVQNGCTCANGIDVTECFVGSCKTGKDQVTFAPGMESEDCDGTYQRFDGDSNPWHDCCDSSVPECVSISTVDHEVPDECPDGGGEFLESTTYHNYKKRPWNENDISQCPGINSYFICEDEDPSADEEENCED